ncbi:MAG TPA: PilZ domain-containing protein [Myxococcaceae bacterium]|nr:PilZ domain-containing protein [Myxococcaceae bacterium]
MSAPGVSPELRAPLSTSVKFFDWNRPQTAEAVEISTRGVFLKTTAPLAEDRLLTLRLQLTDGTRPFTVLGRVIRTVKGSLFRPGGMDVRFIDLAASDRLTIEAYVQRRTLRAA